MRVELNEMEIRVLAMTMDHSPDCVWGQGAPWCYVSPDGSRWCDEDCTVPYVQPECTCGYFAHMDSGKAKLVAALESGAEP